MDIDHKTCAELIPWYVNGTLTGDELAAVRRHIGQCVPCRSILKEEQRARALIRRQADIPLTPEHGMVGLLEKIDRGGGRPRLFPARPRPALALGLAAASIVALGVVGLLMTRDPVAPTGSTEFTTLSTDARASAGRIDIILAPGVGEAGLRSLLDEIGGTVVGGPTGIGRYTIALAPDHRDAAAVSSTLDDLATDPRVRFAGPALIEPASAGGDAP